MLFGGEVMFILFLVLVTSAATLWIRNNWVFDQSIKLLDQDYAKYKQLPNYNTMICKFWIWNIDKFIEEGK